MHKRHSLINILGTPTSVGEPAGPLVKHHLVLTDEYCGIPWHNARDNTVKREAVKKLLVDSMMWGSNIEIFIDARRCPTFGDQLMDEMMKILPPTHFDEAVVSQEDARKSTFLRELNLWDASMKRPTPPRAQRVTDRGLQRLDAPNMRIFMLAGHHWLTPSVVVTCVSKMRYLTTLSVRGMTRLSSKHVKKIVESSPALISLDLYGVFQLTDKVLDTISSSRGDQLTSLDLSHCTRLSLLALREAALRLTKLKRLGLAGLTFVDDGCVRDFVTTAARGHREKASGIASGVASGIASGIRTRSGRDSGWKLRPINLARAVRRSAAAAESGGLADTDSPGLHTLDLSATSITDSGLVFVEEFCTKTIRELSCRRCAGVSDMGVAIVSQCPLLFKLDLSFCDYITTPTAWGPYEIETCRALLYEDDMLWWSQEEAIEK